MANIGAVSLSISVVSMIVLVVDVTTNNFLNGQTSCGQSVHDGDVMLIVDYPAVGYISRSWGVIEDTSLSASVIAGNSSYVTIGSGLDGVSLDTTASLGRVIYIDEDRILLNTDTVFKPTDGFVHLNGIDNHGITLGTPNVDAAYRLIMPAPTTLNHTGMPIAVMGDSVNVETSTREIELSFIVVDANAIVNDGHSMIADPSTGSVTVFDGAEKVSVLNASTFAVHSNDVSFNHDSIVIQSPSVTMAAPNVEFVSSAHVDLASDSWYINSPVVIFDNTGTTDLTAHTSTFSCTSDITVAASAVYIDSPSTSIHADTLSFTGSTTFNATAQYLTVHARRVDMSALGSIDVGSAVVTPNSASVYGLSYDGTTASVGLTNSKTTLSSSALAVTSSSVSITTTSSVTVSSPLITISGSYVRIGNGLAIVNRDVSDNLHGVILTAPSSGSSHTIRLPGARDGVNETDKLIGVATDSDGSGSTGTITLAPVDTIPTLSFTGAYISAHGTTVNYLSNVLEVLNGGDVKLGFSHFTSLGWLVGAQVAISNPLIGLTAWHRSLTYPTFTLSTAGGSTIHSGPYGSFSLFNFTGTGTNFIANPGTTLSDYCGYHCTASVCDSAISVVRHTSINVEGSGTLSTGISFNPALDNCLVVCYMLC